MLATCCLLRGTWSASLLRWGLGQLQCQVRVGVLFGCVLLYGGVS